MASVDSYFLAEIGKVDARSRKKHNGEDWRDMTFMYALLKAIGHIAKYIFAGRGKYNGRRGPHHLAKAAWYFDKIMWMERNRRENDDRPTNPKGKMAPTVLINKIKSVWPGKEAA
jgi:hypothetical protein